MTRPTIQANNVFYYYSNLEAAWLFYRDVLGFKTVGDYGFAKIMRLAQSSFLTLVDAEFGMHTVEEAKSVTLAMVTDQVEGWYDYLTTSGVPMHRFTTGHFFYYSFCQLHPHKFTRNA